DDDESAKAASAVFRVNLPGYFASSSRTMRFVRGPKSAMTIATPHIAIASRVNTAPTPLRVRMAAINTEENAALSRLQLYVKPTAVARMRVGNNSAWEAG